MNNAHVFLLAMGLLAACGRTDNAQTAATQAPRADSGVATPVKKETCQLVAEAGKLGKTDEYQESAKPIKIAITLQQDTSSTATEKGCYYNNTVTILTTKKSGDRVFKRTLLKDDLLYYIKNDKVVQRSVLQKVVYKPTFNAQKYITISMYLIDPVSQQTSAYTVFLNYFGEMVKVK